jgi:hypothetical protein
MEEMFNAIRFADEAPPENRNEANEYISHVRNRVTLTDSP